MIVTDFEKSSRTRALNHAVDLAGKMIQEGLIPWSGDEVVEEAETFRKFLMGEKDESS
jgi:hypothetical protein